MNDQEKTISKLVKTIRGLTLFFIIALILSGITAFPAESELKIGCKILNIDTSLSPDTYSGIQHWIATVYKGLHNTNEAYPFLAYSFDWLAFAHIVIAVFFIGVYRQPIRNIWVVYTGMIACIGIIPLAFICAPIRNIPFYWALIDCSFGVLGIIPLYILHRLIKKLAIATNYQPSKY